MPLPMSPFDERVLCSLDQPSPVSKCKLLLFRLH